MSNTFNRRGIAALAAGAMCGMALFGSAGAAFAQETIPVNLIDPDATTTLNINKYLGAPLEAGVSVPLEAGVSSDGTKVTDITLPTLAGVNFDVYEVVGVDLTTNAGWAAATALQNHTITQAEIAAGSITVDVDVDGVPTPTTFTLATPTTVTTGTGGLATFTGKVALYLVNENLGSSGTITDGTGAVVPNNAITPSKPFLVTLPMTTPSGDGALTEWMYTVHAYPKNAADTITKTVTDQGTVTSEHAGAAALKAFQYQVATSVTPGLTAAEIATYVIGDNLDPRLGLTSVKVTSMVDVDGVPTATDMIPTTDYVVYVNDVVWDGTAIAAGSAKKVEVVLTEAGIAKAMAGGGATTVIDVTTPVADADGLTHVANDAQFIPNAGWWAAHTGDDSPYDPKTDNPGSNGGEKVTPPTSNKVQTIFGALDVTKVDAKDGTALNGAVFAVYKANATGQCLAADMIDSNLISGGHTTSGTVDNGDGTTSDAGKVLINGLQASMFYNDDEITDKSLATVYCLVETKAPDGYNLQAQPMSFTIGHTIDEATGLATAVVETQEVKNVLSNIDNNLPLTGGQGAAILGLGGLIIAGGAGAYAVARRRQDKAEAAQS